MNTYPLSKVRFPRAEAQSFSKTLRQRVNEYFKENGLSYKANGLMKLKTVNMLALYFVPFTLMLIFDPSAIWVLLSFILMGFGMAGVGMSVMHDAAHGAYHKSPRVNDLIASSIYLISGNLTTWRLQHNVLHHTYTNIEGLDDDLDTQGLLRLHPDQKHKKMHRYQVWYAPLLYSLLTLNWVIMKDFSQLIRYQKEGVAKLSGKALRSEWIKLIATKLLYFGLFIALPLSLLSVAWYLPILGFVLMHLIAGFILSFVFQLAHVVDHVQTHSLPKEDGPMRDAFLEHQLQTTSDFARRNKLVSWFVGGLNYQVEHHLFPHICHIHYPAISEIVRKTAHEFGLPYYEHQTLSEAIRAHLRSLKIYGNPRLA